MKNLLMFSIISVCITFARYAEADTGKWDLYINSGRVTCVAFESDYLWCGTSGGVVRIDKHDGSRKKYTILDGLVNNYIQTIAVDMEGIVWAGTYYGMSCFDGSVWKTYTTENVLPDNNISSIAVDHDNVKWFSTGDNGMVSYDGNEWKTYSIKSLAEFDIVNSIAVDANNVKWISGYNVLLSYNGTSWEKWYRNSIGDVKIGPDGTIWSIQNNELVSFDGEEFKVVLGQKDFDDLTYFPGFAIDRDGTVWLSQFGCNEYFLGLLEFDGESWKSYTTEDGLLNLFPQALEIDTEGILWICSGDGLTRYDGREFTHFLTKTDGPIGNGIFDIDIAPDGKLWFASTPGVSIFNGDSWSYYTEDDGLAHSNVYAVAVDENNIAWIGTYGGVSRFDGTSWTTFTAGDGLADTICSAIVVDRNGNVWFGSNNGASLYDGESFSQFAIGRVRDITVGDNNTIWFATTNGLKCFDGEEWETYTGETGLSSNDIKAVTPGKDGTVWIGAKGGVARYDGDTWTAYTTDDGLCYEDVRTLAVDGNGTLWIGTFRGGVSEFDGTYWTTYTTSDGLADNRVMSVAVDENNVKWFGTSCGISSFMDDAGAYITLMSPKGGDKWINEESQTIQWISEDISFVKIEYSTDEGASWNTIVDSVDASSGSYIWIPPDVESNKCIVMVSDASNHEISDSSDSFTITSPYLRVTFPNGGEEFGMGESLSIRWSQLGVETISIEFSSDSGITWNTIASNVDAGTNVFNWSIPYEISSEYIIRIRNETNSSLNDISDAVFNVFEGFIRVTSPNGGEVLEGMTGKKIYWEASSGISFVIIEFSSDNGATWNTLAQNINALKGVFSWYGPNISSSKCIIKISDTSNNNLFDVSDDSFTVVLSALPWKRYTTEDGLSENEIRSVAVDSTGGIWIAGESSRVSYFDGVSWKSFYTGISESSATAIPSIAVDHDGIVWFAPTFDPLLSYEGTKFTQYTDAPNYLRQIVVDQNNVKWMTTWENGLVSFDGKQFNTYKKDNSGILNDNPYSIAVDSDNTLWIGYCWHENVGLSHFDGTEWVHYSTEDGLLSMNVTAIAVDYDGTKLIGTDKGICSFDGVKWKVYDRSDGLWRDEDWVRDIVKDREGVKWFSMEDYMASYDGNTWTNYNDEPIVMHYDKPHDAAIDNNNVKWFATRNGVLTCGLQRVPFVWLTSPKGNEVFMPGNTHEITWMSKGVETVSLEYSKDSGLNWDVIEKDIDAAAESYMWKLPSDESPDYFVRIIDSTNPVICDMSDDSFVVSTQFIKVISPNGGENWDEKSVHKINWLSGGVVNVKIEYTKDNGKTWNVISEHLEAKAGSYSWTIPESETTDCIVKISDISSDNITDVSDSTFKINKVIVSVDDVIPPDFSLSQNYPNPFNPVTVISFSLPYECSVNLTVYNVAGKKIAIIADNVFSAGKHSVEWDAGGFSSGIYFYRVKAGTFTSTKKLMLIK